MNMKKIFFACAALCALVATAEGQTYKSEVWVPDNGDGTYTNPILNADYSDPDVIAVGDDYYLTASSFNCIPGLPILHSRDLVNWRIVGHAVKRLAPAELFDKPNHGKGIWAPAIRHHDGEFYIYWGDPDHGVFMVKTKDPAGDWSEPICVIEGRGMIDTCPLWDDDGRCYLVNGWAGSRAGFNSVLTVRELSADGTRAISDPVIVFDGGSENHTTEGPKLYKRDGWYWIMCPAGGVAMGWQLAMRSKSPYGPYEWKRVMAQGATSVNGPHQGGWVHTSQGEDWFMHFQDRGAYGRAVWLQPVSWKDNWPVMGVLRGHGYCGEPVTTYRKPKTAGRVEQSNPQESDEFDCPVLGKQWQWHANYQQLFGQPTSLGFFRLYTLKESFAFRNLWDAPNLLLQKTPADAFVATAKVKMAAKEEGQYGGIVVMGMDYASLVVQRVGEVFQLQQRTCKDAIDGAAESIDVLATLKPTSADTIPYSPAIYEEVYLRMTVQGGEMTFGWSSDGKRFTDVGTPFTLKKGKWIGAKIGLVAETSKETVNQGFMDIDWFRVTRVRP